MNKQTIIGLVIIGAILFGFSWYQNRQQKKAAEATAELIEARRIEDSIARANAPAPLFDTLEGGTVHKDNSVVLGGATAGKADPLGETMAAARAGGNGSAPSETFALSNDVMSIKFSALGGMISDVALKDYKQYGGGELHMWKPGSQAFDVEFYMRREFNYTPVNTSGFNFTVDMPSAEWADGEEFKRVVMRLPVDSVARVEFVYIIPRNDYMIDFMVDFVGMDDMIAGQSNFDIDWTNIGLQNEKGFDNENNYTTVSYRLPGKKSIEQLGIGRAGDTKQAKESGNIEWLAFKQQFFSSIFIADGAFSNPEMDYRTSQPGDGTIKRFHTKLGVPMENGLTGYKFRFYFGPNKFSKLKEYGIQLERLVPLGGSIIGWVSRLAVIPIFDWLGSKGLGFGLIILVMTFLIKLVIFPLTFTSYKSSAKMRVIKPEVDEINARFPNKEDAMKKQQATMELYRRAGINPMAGCIPMLIQFPIIIAMFRFFPAAIELRQQPLWWADDLSSYDSILDLGFKIPFYGDHISLFALLMSVSMFFYSWINFKQQPSQAGMPGMKFMMLYLMPVMLLLWFNNYAAGLCFYYLISNLFTIVQMYGVRFAINEEKLRKKMLETPRKEKKKSGFMARLEEAQKAQIAAARAQQGKPQGGKKRK